MDRCGLGWATRSWVAPRSAAASVHRLAAPNRQAPALATGTPPTVHGFAPAAAAQLAAPIAPVTARAAASPEAGVWLAMKSIVGVS